MIEGQFLLRPAILAGELVPQEHVEARECGIERGFHIDLQRHHARQLHLACRAVHHLLILRDDVDPVEKHGLDRILPMPERKRIIAERPIIGVEYEGRKGLGR